MSVNALLVDDSVSFRSLLRNRLERFGCDIAAETGSATEGLQLFRRIGPKLVILELLMENEGTYGSKELFEDIRKESPTTEIVVVSLQPKEANASWFLREGALAYLEKPFINFDELHAKLKHAFHELAKRRTLWERLTRRRS